MVVDSFGKRFITKSKTSALAIAGPYSTIKEFTNKDQAKLWAKEENYRLKNDLLNNNFSDSFEEILKANNRIDNNIDDEVGQIKTDGDNFGPIYLVETKPLKQETFISDSKEEIDRIFQQKQPIKSKYNNFIELAKNKKYNSIEIYTDGSYFYQYPNLFIGSFIFVDSLTNKIIKQQSFTKTIDKSNYGTSNISERLAIKLALKELAKGNYDFALLNTDSDASIKKQDELINSIELDTKVFFNHVKGHDKSYFNNYVDNLCREKIKQRIPFIEEQNKWLVKGNRYLVNKLKNSELVEDWNLLKDIDFKVVRKNFNLADDIDYDEEIETLSIGSSKNVTGTFCLAIIKKDDILEQKFYKISNHNIFYQKY